MNRRLFAATWLSLALLAPGLSAAAAEPASIAQSAEAVLARLAPAESHVGVSVVDVATGETLYEREARKLFAPASLAKLATSAAALSYLGASKRFTTKLLIDGSASGGIVRGHLYLKGEGDPTLTVADLDALASTLKSQGIKTITGDVAADASYFQPEGPGAPGWPWDDLDETYGAPASALTLSGNVGTVTVAPGAPGQAARVTMRPMAGYLDLTNRATTAAAGAAATLALTAQRLSPWKETWTLTGQVPAGGGPVELGRSVADPARFAAVAMKEALVRQGIAVHGTVRLATAPGAARAVAAHASAPLAELVYTMNKESSNLIAETLLLHLGVRGQGGPGTRDKGLRTLRAFLERNGWEAGTYRLEDGAGLSTYDALMPCQLTALLRAMPAEALSYPAYLISLPVAGVDGTLSTRFSDPAVRGRLRAKTGTRSSVSGLAGYLVTDSGRTVAVAFMVYGFVGSAAKARALQEGLIQAIAQADSAPVEPGPALTP
ncbi:MAG: D-alanyl-D-alanine carboxypeptidase/D-alanyl-D-alanine-endopeptidase [Candidatus Sericytochromatia bacterium]